MANTFLQKFVKVFIQDLNNIPDIANNFEDIFLFQRRENVYPALLVDFAKVDNLVYGYNYYGSSDIDLLLTVFVKSSLSDAIGLFDLLIKNLNCYSSKNDTEKISYVIEYTGGYNELVDVESQEISITSTWKCRVLNIG